MKAYLKKATAVLALLMCFSGCGDADTGEALTEELTQTADITTEADTKIKLVAEDGTCRYVIVRPDKDNSIEVKALSVIRTAITETLGVKPEVKTDWLNTKANEQPGEYEILIAGTNRAESAEAAAGLTEKMDYTVRVIGKKICIAGGSDTALLYAADCFAELLKTNKGVLDADYACLEKCRASDLIAHISGESAFESKEIYDGVYYTHYSLSETSPYGKQEIYTVEFDPERTDLSFDVVQNGTYATSTVKTSAVAEKFTAADNGKTVIAAINGDLWMTNAHSRNLGGTTSYKDYSDYVTTKTLTVPRGFNMYDGEIITSAHMKAETPYEGAFYSFGITDDGTPVLGNPRVSINIVKSSTMTGMSADGLNRLPANDSLVMYTDAIKSNNCLDEAYELVIECGEYKVCHGAKITGKVTKIIAVGEATQDIAPGEIRLTARGTRIESLKYFALGDNVEISVYLTDEMGKTALWTNMKNAVGGHIPLIINGKSQNSTNNTVYPMTVLGFKADGTVVMLVADGRGAGGAVGLKISEADELCAELGIETAFLLDGGGSSGLVLEDKGKYVIVNNPSDGSERSVVNSVILSVKK